MPEKWRGVKGYEGIYEISNLGRIRSLDREVVRSDGQIKHFKGKERKQRIGTTGYYIIDLCKHGCTSTHKVHRLLAEAFTPNPKGKPCINHKNRDRSDNRLQNLEWVTHSENAYHAINMGVFRRTGENCSYSKITDDIVKELKSKYPLKTQRELAQEYGLAHSTVWQIVNRETWKHVN